MFYIINGANLFWQFHVINLLYSYVLISSQCRIKIILESLAVENLVWWPLKDNLTILPTGKMLSIVAPPECVLLNLSL